MAYADTILAESSLVAFWQLQETSGTTAADSKSARPGSYNGTYTLGQSGPNASSTSVRFSSGTGYVHVPSVGSLTGAYSFECWLNEPGTRNPNIFAGSRGPSDCGFDCQIAFTSFHCDIGNGSSWLTTSANQFGSVPSTNTWHHFVLVAATTGWVIYQDGVNVGEGSYSAGTPLAFDASHQLRLANNNVDGAFDGYLAYCALYNVALSATQVATHHTAMTAVVVERRTGSVGVNVDLTPVEIAVNRRTGALGVNVDIAPVTTFPLIGAATQAQALALQSSVITAPVATLVRTVQVTQTVTGSITKPLTLGTVSIGQSVTLGLARGYRHTVTATQATSTRLLKSLALMRRLTGTHRVETRVSSRGVSGRVVRATQASSVRLLRQVHLTRAVSQSQTVSGSGLPVELRAVATVQTRSLALELAIVFMRAIGVAQTAWLERLLALERSLVQSTAAIVERASTLTREAVQATSVSLDVQDVTPFQEVVVSTTVAQALSLSMTGTGQPARGFIVVDRDGEFVLPGRRDEFVVARRGVRFTVEAR